MSLTVCDKLLMAAFDLDSGEEESFTAEDLVVAAWRRFPRAFGLRGHNDDQGMPLYPDSNRVFAEIMGSKPIRKRGYLVKVGQKVYSLTVSGREMALRLCNSSSAESPESDTQGGKATLSRRILAKLDRLLGSRAVLRVQMGQEGRITFHDACMFWSITPGSTSIELEGRLANLESVIKHAEEAIKSGASELRTGSDDLSNSTPELLRKVHKTLLERFPQELDTIRQRATQR